MRRYLFLICLIVAGYHASGQDSLSSSHFAVYAFAGPNFYKNNWQVFKNSVNTVNYTIGGRFMWEPGHRLSMGINTGYYKIYTADVKGTAASAHFQMVAIPIQLLMKMELYRGIYAFYGMGPSICHNTITPKNGSEFKGSFVSFADVTFAGGYSHTFANKKLTLGGEVNFFHSSKSKENIISTMVVFGYKL